MRNIIFATSVALVLLLSACGQSTDKAADKAAPATTAPAASDAAPAAPAKESAPATESAPAK